MQAGTEFFQCVALVLWGEAEQMAGIFVFLPVVPRPGSRIGPDEVGERDPKRAGYIRVSLKECDWPR